MANGYGHFNFRAKRGVKSRGERRHVFAFTASLIFHCVFALSFFYYSGGSVVLIEDQVVKGDIVDFDIMDGMLSSEVDPVYDKNSPFVIKPSSLIKKRKDQSLMDLLDKLRDVKTTGLSGRTSTKRKKYESQIGQGDYKLKAEWGWKGAKKKVPSQQGKSLEPGERACNRIPPQIKMSTILKL